MMCGFVAVLRKRIDVCGALSPENDSNQRSRLKPTENPNHVLFVSSHFSVGGFEMFRDPKPQTPKP